MPQPPFRLVPLLFGAVLLFSGCASMSRSTRPSPPPPPPAAMPVPVKKPVSYWNGEGLSGAPSIVVHLGEQRAYFYRGKKLAGVSQVSSGRKGFETIHGSFKVIQKDLHHESTLYGSYVDADGSVVKSDVTAGKTLRPPGSTFRGAKMPYFMRFYEGYGLHAGNVPNFPASHGCVRLPTFMAQHFYQNAELGTPVRVEN